MDPISAVEAKYLKDKIPEFGSGDTLRVHTKIIEGDKERVQIFEGVVIQRKGKGTGETFTLRKVSSGVEVERIFPLYSPNITKINRVRQGKVRRAKLFYLRGLKGKSARIQEKRKEEKESPES
ncbi:MAG: 50S ribosomal protein L19 [candidate division Zixibacteria bacterium SM23_73_3]|nr:MAG: 50S ribosomal protein L19 [candidate division Zixibacteria bacterium SM23_73_3]